jgi:hypothetical protein
MSTTRAELGRFERIEPRCRVCRDPVMRHLVNQRLDWVRTPIIKHEGKSHTVTYADIFRALEPLNKTRDERERVSYDSLWVHARRHHDVAAVGAYLMAKMLKELVKTLGSSKVRTKLPQGERH